MAARAGTRGHCWQGWETCFTIRLGPNKPATLPGHLTSSPLSEPGWQPSAP